LADGRYPGGDPEVPKPVAKGILQMKRTRTDYIAIHCSATPPKMDIGVDEIRQMHLQRGFKDIGYNRLIRRNGEWEQGREDDEVGAHVEDRTKDL